MDLHRKTLRALNRPEAARTGEPLFGCTVFTCRGARARGTMDQLRRVALRTRYAAHRRAPAQQQPQQLELAVDGRGHERGGGLPGPPAPQRAREVWVGAALQQQPRHLGSGRTASDVNEQAVDKQ